MQVTLINFALVVETLVLFTLLAVRAEEQSILNGAVLSGYDVMAHKTWNELSLIDGSFKSLYYNSFTDINGDG